MIFELLQEGRANARTAKELGEALQLRPRDISAIIERERRAGRPICASTDAKKPGYYIPTTREDMQAYCKSLRHRAGEIFATRRACLKAAESLPTREGAEYGD